MNPNDADFSGLPEFRDTSRRFVALVGVLGALALAAFFFSRPVYKVIKERHALNMVEQAGPLLAQGRVQEAARIVKIAVELAPKRPEVLRFVGRYAAKVGLADGITYWQNLLALPDSSEQDRLEYASFCLDLNRLDLTGPMITERLAARPTDPFWLRLAVRHSRQEGRLDQAVAAAQTWIEARPNDDEAMLELGQLLLNRSDAAEREEGRRLLWSVASGSSDFRDRAVDALVGLPDLSKEDVLLLLATLSGKPGREFTVRSLKVRAHPDQKAAVVSEVIAAAQMAGTNHETLRSAAAWLAEHGEIGRVLEVLPEAALKGDSSLLTARLQALIELGRPSEALAWLDREDSPIEGHLANCLRAAVARATGKPQQVPGFFEAALNNCRGIPARLLFVAAYAEKIGEDRAAVEAYKRLLSWPPTTYVAGQAILRLVATQRDSRIERDTLKRLSDFMPGNDQFFVVSCYYGLLLGEKLGPARARLESLASAKPAEPLFAVVLALADLREAEPARALTRLDDLKVDWAVLDPRYRAVYAAVLGANQQREAARTMARRLDAASLRTEERQLIQEWL
jgi:tetratricopeptide (TPR) repeat protein